MKVAIHGKSTGPEAQHCIQELLNIMDGQSHELAISEVYKSSLREKSFEVNNIKTFNISEDISGYDFLFSLGGDGTILDSVTYARSYEIPIVGINLGRLGFLSTISRSEIENVMQRLQAKEYRIESRSLLHMDSNQNLFAPHSFGLNEMTITKKESSSMIVVHTYVDGSYLNSYWADGLIVATPTGSTGYSLSCGGPLVHPSQKNFIITPVSPHNLNVRPMILSDQSKITFEIEGRSKEFLVSLDSRSVSVDDSVEISIQREQFEAKLVRFADSDYFDTLRNKLNWGLDARN